MTTARSYVIVTSSGRTVRHHRHGAGRHRFAASASCRRPAPSGPPAARRRPRRGRHRRRPQSSQLAARYGTLVVLSGTLGISSWFAATGAAALAQIMHP